LPEPPEAPISEDDPRDALRERIEALEPDSLTPKQALSVLYDLKAAVRDDTP